MEHATLATKQAACTYDHSGTVCNKCGFYNDQAARKQRAKACHQRRAQHPEVRNTYDFGQGFEAGYAYANELLKAFYELTGLRIL